MVKTLDIFLCISGDCQRRSYPFSSYRTPLRTGTGAAPAEFENGKEFEHAGGKYYVEKKETPILMDKEGKPFDDCNRRKSSK